MALGVNIILPNGSSGSYLRIASLTGDKEKAFIKCHLYVDHNHRIDNKPFLAEFDHGFKDTENPIKPGVEDIWDAMYTALKTLYPGATDV